MQVPEVSEVPVTPSLDNFQNLPADIRKCFLPNLLPSKTLLSLCRTRKEYQQLCDDPRTWERYLLQEFKFDWNSRADDLNEILLPPTSNKPSNQRIFFEYLRLTGGDQDPKQLIYILQEVSKIIGGKVDFLRFYQRSLLAGYFLDDRAYLDSRFRKQNLYDFLIKDVKEIGILDFIANSLTTLYLGPDLNDLRELTPLYLIEVEMRFVTYTFIVNNYYLIDLTFENTTFTNYDDTSTLTIRPSRKPARQGMERQRTERQSNWDIELETRNPEVAKNLITIGADVILRLKQPLPTINEIVNHLAQELDLAKSNARENIWRSQDRLTTLELDH